MEFEKFPFVFQESSLLKKNWFMLNVRILSYVMATITWALKYVLTMHDCTTEANGSEHIEIARAVCCNSL